MHNPVWNAMHVTSLRYAMSGKAFMRTRLPINLWGAVFKRQTCLLCAGDDVLSMVVDPRTQMRKSLRNLPVDGTLDSLTITLPCRHVFTIAALDDTLGLSEFYEKGKEVNGPNQAYLEESGPKRHAQPAMVALTHYAMDDL
ncbi:hypothetical protein OPQ81_003191 [Rhizoctonia solani]|nr:hypothetical protein OPQ81_003191 [Rhizoctonia solani]